MLIKTKRNILSKKKKKKTKKNQKWVQLKTKEMKQFWPDKRTLVGGLRLWKAFVFIGKPLSSSVRLCLHRFNRILDPFFFPHSFLESGLFVFEFGSGCKKSPCLSKEVV